MKLNVNRRDSVPPTVRRLNIQRHHHDSATSPMTIDEYSQTLLDALIDELAIAIPRAFTSLSDEFADLCGFAIGTARLLEFIVPVFQRKSELSSDSGDFARFFPPEWAVLNSRDRSDTFGDGVETARKHLETHCSAGDYDLRASVSDAFLGSLLSLLVDLVRNNQLGQKTNERSLTIWIAGDDLEWIIKASERLNTPELHQRVLSM